MLYKIFMNTELGNNKLYVLENVCGYIWKKPVDIYAHILLRLWYYIPKTTHPIAVCFAKEKMKFRSDTWFTWGFLTNSCRSCDLNPFQLTKWSFLPSTTCFLPSSLPSPLCMKLNQEGRISPCSSSAGTVPVTQLPEWGSSLSICWAITPTIVLSYQAKGFCICN